MTAAADRSHYDATDPPTPALDELVPWRIAHRVDDIFHAGALQQRYNYLVYEFDAGRTRVQAKTYLDDIGTVELFFVALTTEPDEHLPDEPIDPRILTYLRRRFDRLTRWSRSARAHVPID